MTPSPSPGRLPLSSSERRRDRVLPKTLRRRVEALETTLGFTARPTVGAPVAGEAVLLPAEAIRRRRRIRAGYRSFSSEETRRELSPHGLVVHSGRWYLAVHDHVRDDLRTFRSTAYAGRWSPTTRRSRRRTDSTRWSTSAAPLARVPWPWEVEVLLDLPREAAAQRLLATLAELVELDEALC